jgi:hypothetical protein
LQGSAGGQIESRVSINADERSCEGGAGRRRAGCVRPVQVTLCHLLGSAVEALPA